MGVNESAINNETDNVTTIVTGRLLIKSPASCGIRAMGINASTVVNVALTIGQPISEAAFIEASLGLYPIAIKRLIFSTITMELSTSIPSATTRPPIEICCNPQPNLSTTLNPIIIDRGMAIITTSADLKPNKSKMINPTSRIP